MKSKNTNAKRQVVSHTVQPFVGRLNEVGPEAFGFFRDCPFERKTAFGSAATICAIGMDMMSNRGYAGSTATATEVGINNLLFAVMHIAMELHYQNTPNTAVSGPTPGGNHEQN